MLLLQGGGLAGSGQGADSTGGSVQRVPRGVRPAAPTADASCRALHAPCPRRRTRGQSAAPKPQRSSPRGLPVQDPVPGRHVASRPQPAAQRLSGDEPPGSEGVSGWPDRGPRMPRPVAAAKATCFSVSGCQAPPFWQRSKPCAKPVLGQGARRSERTLSLGSPWNTAAWKTGPLGATSAPLGPLSHHVEGCASGLSSGAPLSVRVRTPTFLNVRGRWTTELAAKYFPNIQTRPSRCSRRPSRDSRVLPAFRSSLQPRATRRVTQGPLQGASAFPEAAARNQGRGQTYVVLTCLCCVPGQQAQRTSSSP